MGTGFVDGRFGWRRLKLGLGLWVVGLTGEG